MTVRTIDDIFRDFVTDGVPASGPFNPHKPDIRDTLKALTEGSENFPDNRVIRLNNANAGTANNIVVTASVAIPSAAYQVLYILNVTQENTGPVTVSGAINRALVTNTSAPLPSGYLTPGMAILCIDTGSELRMLSYGDVETLLDDVEQAVDAARAAQAEAEQARDEAVAAASDAVSQGSVPIYSARDAVEGMEIPVGINAIRTNGFASVGDGGGALYIRVVTEPTHFGKVRSSDGAWFEIVGPLNIRQFGAKGDNITDDTNAINDAISTADDLSEGELHIPAGSYVLSQLIDMPVNSPLIITGDGQTRTVFRQGNPSEGGIRFRRNNYTSLGGGIRDCSIEAGPGFLNSGFFGDGSSGTGLDLVRPNDGFFVENVGVYNFAVSMAEKGGWNARYRNLVSLFYRYSGFLITKSDDGVVGGSSTLLTSKVSNNGYTGAVKTDAKGLDIRATGGFQFGKVDVTGAYNGVHVKPAAGDQVAYLFFDTVLADTCLGDGWVFDGTDGKIVTVGGSLCWGAYCDGNGMVTKGANLDDLTMTNMALRQNRLRGWHNQGGTNLSLDAAKVAANSRDNPVHMPGIEIDSAVVDWKITSCRIGNYANAGVVSQGDGVRINSGADYGVVVGNKCNGSAPGYAGVNNMSIAPDIIVANNQS